MLCKTAGLARQGTLTCTENLRRGALADMSKRREGVPKMATLGFCLQEARVSRWRLRAHQDQKYILVWHGSPLYSPERTRLRQILGRTTRPWDWISSSSGEVPKPCPSWK